MLVLHLGMILTSNFNKIRLFKTMNKNKVFCTQGRRRKKIKKKEK